jgi:hypothetical protein
MTLTEMSTGSHEISRRPCKNWNYTSFFHSLPQDTSNNINHYCIDNDIDRKEWAEMAAYSLFSLLFRGIADEVGDG